MTSEGLGEMFEGDSADMCAGKFPPVLIGAERRVSRAQTLERGPPSALAEYFFRIICMKLNAQHDMPYRIHKMRCTEQKA